MKENYDNSLMDYANYDGGVERNLPCVFRIDDKEVFFSFREDGEQSFRGRATKDGHYALVNTTGDSARLTLHRTPGSATIEGYYVYPGITEGLLRIHLEKA
ncbi:hypothetical protein [Bradyrhizobium sp. 2S1]|uniref:hypothetical protein n=1 Tax=Bradyrhizobium sp. 2S1 TaxID=1404429 RepID=UPI0014084BCC|nr:hypothetical protein [Bradyrhizobium sp. 2S1]MCK7673883.1 hypothetical protein [Bradyrhizobium sp. 2S1]